MAFLIRRCHGASLESPPLFSPLRQRQPLGGDRSSIRLASLQKKPKGVYFPLDTAAGTPCLNRKMGLPLPD